MTKEKSKVKDFIKSPILIKNIHNYEMISEKILQKLILEDIENFMKELGNSFCFIASEYKIKLGICKKDNKFIMEYCSDKRIIIKEYELI